MNIILTEGFRNECQKRFHITDSAVFSTIRGPDKSQTLHLDEKQLDFYFKKEAENGYPLLVCSQWEGEDLLVDSGFKIPPDFIDDALSVEPLDILRNLAIKFGLTIRIGPYFNRFIFRYTVKLSEKSDLTALIGIINPENHSFRSSLFVKPNYDLKTIDCALAYCIDLDSCSAWLEGTNSDVPSPDEGIELTTAHFGRLKEMLAGELFPPNWFNKQRNSTHPAYHDYSLLTNMIHQGPLEWPEQRDEIPKIGKTIFNLQALFTLLGGEISQNKSVSLDSFCKDDDVKKDMRARMLDRDQYEPLIVELATASWCKERGYTIEFVKTQHGEHSPDLLVYTGPSTLPLIIECKCITTQLIKSNPRKKLNKIINNANKQIRDRISRLNTPNGCLGVVVVDVTIPLGIEQVTSDVLPKPIGDIRDALQSILWTRNKSIGAALIIWEDHIVHGTPPEPSYYAPRRRFLRVDHQAPAVPIPNDLLLFQGKTVSFWTFWTPRPSVQ